jgi:hypothetical protein
VKLCVASDLRARLDSANRLAAGGACVAFGIDGGMHSHENWREFPVMVSVRFTLLRALRAPRASPPNCSIATT